MVFTFDAIINFSATGRVQFGRYGLKLNGKAILERKDNPYKENNNDNFR